MAGLNLAVALWRNPNFKNKTLFQHSQESITAEEQSRFENSKHKSLFPILARNIKHPDAEQEGFVDVYQASVVKCFVPLDFNEELPLYFLDLGGMILVLFGQWMFDPHTLIAAEDVFDTWKCERTFFQSFSLRCLGARGKVFQLGVKGNCLVEAERLSCVPRFKQLRECQLVAGHSLTLIDDLRSAGIIENE